MRHLRLLNLRLIALLTKLRSFHCYVFHQRYHRHGATYLDPRDRKQWYRHVFCLLCDATHDYPLPNPNPKKEHSQ